MCCQECVRFPTVVHHPRKTHGQPLHTVSPYSFCLSYICEALTFRYRGRYPADDDNEDEPLSEDDAWEFPTPVQDDNEGWESVPRPHLNVANRNNDSVVGNEQEKAPFYATSKDIAFVRSAFPLPPELVTQILDLAEYLVYSQKTLSEPNVYRDANARYLRSGPIRGGEFTYCHQSILSKIIIITSPTLVVLLFPPYIPTTPPGFQSPILSPTASTPSCEDDGR